MAETILSNMQRILNFSNSEVKIRGLELKEVATGMVDNNPQYTTLLSQYEEEERVEVREQIITQVLQAEAFLLQHINIIKTNYSIIAAELVRIDMVVESEELSRLRQSEYLLRCDYIWDAYCRMVQAALTLYFKLPNEVFNLGATIQDYRLKLVRISVVEGDGVMFSDIVAKPTTINGYGITDAYNKNYIDDYLQKDAVGMSVYAGHTVIGDQLTVPSGTARLYTTSDHTGMIRDYLVAEKTFTIPVGVVQFIVVKYGVEKTYYDMVTDSSLINYSNIYPVVTAIYDGVFVHTLNWSTSAVGAIGKMVRRFINTQRFVREGGLSISVDGSRQITVTTGNIWYGLNRVTYPTISSATNNLYFYYHSNGAWIFERKATLNNMQYDNGTNLVALTNSQRYAVNWIYAGVGDDGDIFTVLGRGDYKLDEALSEAYPTDLPDVVRFHGILIGRVIYAQALNTPYAVIPISESKAATGAAIAEHNNLSNIQGGSSVLGEYYHLTLLQYSLFNLLRVNGSNIEIGTATDNTTFESDGTLKMNGAATTFEDEEGDAGALRQLGTGVSYSTVENAVDFAATATSSDYIVKGMQLKHKWKLGSVIFPHIHYIQKAATLANFVIDYRWQRNGQAATTAWTRVICYTPSYTYTSGNLNQILHTASGITPPNGYSISDIVDFRIWRDVNNSTGLFGGADSTLGVVSLKSFDVHVEQDTLGSRTEYSK